jgi:protein phosphatase
VRRLTRDHLYVTDVLGLPDEAARASRQRHVLSRALGVVETLQPEVVSVPLEAGDRILLCTDGVTDVVGDEEIGAVIDRPTPRRSVRRLLALARLRRARDNASALVIGVSDFAPD